MKQCFIGAQPCQNPLIYHASSANTCLFFYKPLAPIWPPIHQQKPECTHSPGGGITGYLLSDMTFELNRRLVDRLTLSPTLGATGLLLRPAQQRTKSPHSDWIHRDTGPFSAKHRRMFYSTKRVVNHCTVIQQKGWQWYFVFYFITIVCEVGWELYYYTTILEGTSGQRKCVICK